VRLQTAIDNELQDIPLSLLAFCHANYYIAFAVILRGHFATSFNLLRVALDASFVAYRLMMNDGTVQDYMNEHNTFKFVKRYIKENESSLPPRIQKQKSSFPCTKSAAGVQIMLVSYLYTRDPSTWGNSYTLGCTEMKSVFLAHAMSSLPPTPLF
jgi:hypothetical protein